MASIWAYMCGLLRVHSNHLLCPSIPKFTDLVCSVHQEPSRQKVASIWAYMCNILKVHSNHSLCPSIPKFTDLICSVRKDPSHQKVASIWAYLCSILRVHSNHSLFPSSLALPSKSGFHLSLYVQYTEISVRPCLFWVRTDTGAFQVMHPYSVCLA